MGHRRSDLPPPDGPALPAPGPTPAHRSVAEPVSDQHRQVAARPPAAARAPAIEAVAVPEKVAEGVEPEDLHGPSMKTRVGQGVTPANPPGLR